MAAAARWGGGRGWEWKREREIDLPFAPLLLLPLSSFIYYFLFPIGHCLDFSACYRSVAAAAVAAIAAAEIASVLGVDETKVIQIRSIPTSAICQQGEERRGREGGREQHTCLSALRYSLSAQQASRGDSRSQGSGSQ